MTVNTLLIIIGIILWIWYCWWTISTLKKVGWNTYSDELSDNKGFILFISTGISFAGTVVIIVMILVWIIVDYGNTIIF